jgi:hypothetical protein
MVVDKIGVDSDEYSTKETDQVDKYCMPMPSAFGKLPHKRGTILFAMGSTGKLSCSWIATAEGESSTCGGLWGGQVYGWFSGSMGRVVGEGYFLQRKSAHCI